MLEVIQSGKETPVNIQLCRSLAFFLPGFVDGAHLSVVQHEAVQRADYVAIADRPHALEAADMTGFEEVLQELGALAGQKPGELGLVIPTRLSKSTGLNRLGVYSVGTRRGSLGGNVVTEEMATLIIPSANITGAQALPYQTGVDRFDPKLNVRIQTPEDPPLTVVSRSGRTSVPSPGRWYGWPLREVLLAKSI